MANTVSEMNQILEQADCLHTRADIDQALDRLASEFETAVQTANPVILCIMNGGLVIAGQLLPRLTFPCSWTMPMFPVIGRPPPAERSSGWYARRPSLPAEPWS